MKWPLYIAFVLFALPAAGQQPALLSMEGFGGEHEDQVLPFVSRTNDGGFVVHINSGSQTGNVNTSCTTSGSRFVFNKYNSNGSTLEWQDCTPWQQDSNYYYRFELNNGEIIWGGATTLTGGRDFLIQKRDAAGNVIWTKKYGGTGTELLRDMIVTDDSCYIMYGISYSNDGDVGLHYGSSFSSDLWAIKIDSSGNKLWAVVVGGSNDDGARSLSQAPGGGCYLYAGTISSDYDCVTYHGGGDALVARIDGGGNIMWAKCYGGTSSDGSYGAITHDNNGGAFVATGASSNDGDVSNHIGNEDFWLFSIDSSGSILWDNCFGGGATEFPKAICISSDGSIWMGGSSSSTNGQVGVGYGGGDAWIVHADPFGNYLGSKVLGTNASDDLRMLYHMSNGMIIAGGVYRASGLTGDGLPATWSGLYDIFLARFAPWTTSIEDVSMINSITIYPNPVSDRLFVSVKSAEDITIAVSDVLGNEVLRGSGQKLESGIDVGAWPRGMYYLRVTSSNGQSVRGLVLQ